MCITRVNPSELITVRTVRWEMQLLMDGQGFLNFFFSGGLHRAIFAAGSLQFFSKPQKNGQFLKGGKKLKLVKGKRIRVKGGYISHYKKKDLWITFLSLPHLHSNTRALANSSILFYSL